MTENSAIPLVLECYTAVQKHCDNHGLLLKSSGCNKRAYAVNETVIDTKEVANPKGTADNWECFCVKFCRP